MICNGISKATRRVEERLIWIFPYEVLNSMIVAWLYQMAATRNCLLYWTDGKAYSTMQISRQQQLSRSARQQTGKFGVSSLQNKSMPV